MFDVTFIAELGKQIRDGGGRYSTTVNDSVTHLVVTSRAWANSNKKGKFNRCRVHVSWPRPVSKVGFFFWFMYKLVF